MKKLKRFCSKNSTTILSIVSMLTGLAALYFTGRATVKAVRKYDQLKDEGIEVTPKVIFKQFVPYYIPTIGFAATSIGCHIACNTIHVKHNRALSIIAANAIESLRDFKSKTKEIAGDKVYDEIFESRAKDASLITSPCDHMWQKIRVYDDFTRMKFETTWEKLKDAQDEVNRRLNSPWMGPSKIELRDFYRCMGVDLSQAKTIAQDCYTWDTEYMNVNWELSYVDFFDKNVIKDSDGTDMILLRYFPEPEPIHSLDTYFAVHEN